MSRNFGRYSYVPFITIIVIFLDIIREVFEGQSNADNKENKQKNNHHPKTHFLNMIRTTHMLVNTY